ncbi:hypothetical protein ACPZ19_23135 [Amycolatopsis lurida]
MVLAREVSNPELETVVGFTLTGEVRRQLNDLGYVNSRKSGRSYSHELTDSGWNWCGREMGVKTPPPNSRSNLINGLYVLLGGIDEYLRRQGLQLAHVFTPEVELTEEEIERRIREAYRQLAGTSREWVGLIDLRPKLGEAPRKEVDAVLKELSRQGRLHLIPEDNRKALTPADHEAAIRVGGDDNHLLKIEVP